MISLIPNSKSKVSSVLNNQRENGKDYMFDDSVESAWYSDAGSPQWIIIDFQGKVIIKELRLMFQGGFAANVCTIHYLQGKKFEEVCSFYPEENNEEQSFQLEPEHQVEVTRVKLLLNELTDFYGRVIIYKCDILGERIE
eukprot:TRINITY_DN9032_c0_g1_i1.p1 TRINITY_DN9032_c0_g1~~TRINITY_DN9032_c0_g1_i1.p1  ORF type:complete len:140 (+),score=33.57 TRINITY_DN9032_c0_g1_i1:3-422(+)